MTGIFYFNDSSAKQDFPFLLDDFNITGNSSVIVCSKKTSASKFGSKHSRTKNKGGRCAPRTKAKQLKTRGCFPKRKLRKKTHLKRAAKKQRQEAGKILNNRL